jgi:2,3-bisphosphoglycerate-dependent phosphoglycerate mutase
MCDRNPESKALKFVLMVARARNFYDWPMPGILVLLRHGQSTWNEQNLFTGWHDVPLTERGTREAQSAGRTMHEAGLRFSTSHTSLLTRAIETHRLALHEMGQDDLETHRSWRLNERHYGALQGLDKKETTARHGAQQTHVWRRSFDVPPPAVATDSPEHPVNDPRYKQLIAEGLDPTLLPATECLKDVLERVLPYWNDVIAPQLRAGQNVLVTAHGNSLRALVMHLEHIAPDEIAEFNIPTGVPRRYRFTDDMHVAEVGYLGDEAAIAAATEAVARQAGH